MATEEHHPRHVMCLLMVALTAADSIELVGTTLGWDIGTTPTITGSKLKELVGSTKLGTCGNIIARMTDLLRLLQMGPNAPRPIKSRRARGVNLRS